MHALAAPPNVVISTTVHKYVNGIDFNSTLTDSTVTAKPLTQDTKDTYFILQHNINRVRDGLDLPSIPENGIIDITTFRGVFEIANSDRAIAFTQPFMADLAPQQPFSSFIMLGPFRSQTANSSDLIAHANVEINELAVHARLWAALFGSLADTLWYSQGLFTGPSLPVSETGTGRGKLFGGIAAGLVIGAGAVYLAMRLLS